MKNSGQQLGGWVGQSDPQKCRKSDQNVRKLRHKNRKYCKNVKNLGGSDDWSRHFVEIFFLKKSRDFSTSVYLAVKLSSGIQNYLFWAGIRLSCHKSAVFQSQVMKYTVFVVILGGGSTRNGQDGIKMHQIGWVGPTSFFDLEFLDTLSKIFRHEAPWSP